MEKFKKSFTKSWLETYIEIQIKKDFKNLEIISNDKNLLDNKYEIDIYLPNIKSAIEIHGIFHYKPILGQKKFKKTLNRDEIKKNMLIEKNISLFVLNASKLPKFDEKFAYTLYLQVKNFINEKLKTPL